MDGFQAFAEFADAQGDAVAEVRGKMAELPLDPLGDGFAAAIDQDGHCDHDRDQADQQEAALLEALVVLGMRDGRKRAGQKNGEQHQERESAEIENAFDGPGGQLRREGKILAAGDQVWTDKFPSAAEQGKTGEANQSRREQVHQLGVGADRLEKNFPAYGAQQIREVNKGGCVQYLELVDAMELLPERGPVECSPVAVLQVNQSSKDEERDTAGQKAFFVHERKPCRADQSHGSRRTPCTLTECWGSVNAEGCGGGQVLE